MSVRRRERAQGELTGCAVEEESWTVDKSCIHCSILSASSSSTGIFISIPVVYSTDRS